MGGVHQIMASMAHLCTGTAAALAVHQPTCVAKVPAAPQAVKGTAHFLVKIRSTCNAHVNVEVCSLDQGEARLRAIHQVPP